MLPVTLLLLFPMPQATQTVAEPAEEYVPAEQDAQVAAAASEYFPFKQATQPLDPGDSVALPAAH